MATAQTNYEKFLANNLITQYDHDPAGDATTALVVPATYLDMRDFEGCAIGVFHSVGADVVDSFLVKGATDSAGSGATTIMEYTAAADPDAVGDHVWFEVSAEQMQAVGSTLRYISLSLVCDTGTDECVVTFIRYGAKRPQRALTSDVVA